jgi:hypothetical protein
MGIEQQEKREIHAAQADSVGYRGHFWRGLR